MDPPFIRCYQSNRMKGEIFISTFSLKLIAMICMLLDHIVSVFGDGWNLLPFHAGVLREIGRTAFPIFAFGIVNGWIHSRDRERYFSNLCLCALISQLPYSLAFYPPNQSPYSFGAAFVVSFNPMLLAVAFACVLTYWYFGLKRKVRPSMLLLAVVCLIPVVYIKVFGFWVLADNLNVLYDLLLGFCVIFCIETLQRRCLRWWEALWLIGITGLALLVYGLNTGYGVCLMGVLLITALYFARGKKIHQSVAIVLWGIILYGVIIGNYRNAVACILPGLLLLTYNGKKGNHGGGFKKLFYIFYPAHLLVLGLFNIVLRLGG